MPEVLLWDMADITTTGSDPFAEGHSAPSGVIGSSTFRIDPGAKMVRANIDDHDNEFEETTSQDLIDPLTIDGKTFEAGEFISTEYSYVVRPLGSSDPADNITIIVTKVGWDDIVGIATTASLQKGVDYQFLSVEDNNPAPNYNTLFVCFATGTEISTPGGPRAVQNLSPGDLVLTRDDGPQSIVWIGRRTVVFDDTNAAQRPILIPAGSLGPGVPRGDLVTSPQHRIVLDAAEEVFCPAKAFIGFQGARQLRGKRSVTYHTLLMERHQVIFAEGAPVESFFLGPMSRKILSRKELREIDALTLVKPSLAVARLARRSLTVRKGRATLKEMILEGEAA